MIKNKINLTFLKVATIVGMLFFTAYFCTACQEQKVQSGKTISCPETVLPEGVGEFDPIANPNAKPCGTITLWGSSMPKSFNMWEDYNSFSAELMSLLFEPLVSLHSNENREVGILAESFEIGADGKTFTFKINPKARWSDGHSIDAEDVQFYYDVMMNPKNLTPIFKVGLSRFDRPEILDSLTVRLVAKESHWGNFWEAAGITAFPKHVWENVDFNSVRYNFPVVSGPYKIKTFREDRFVELERRADWWGLSKNWNRGKYNFEKIRFRFMEDQTKVLEAFKKQDFDAYALYTSSIWMKQTDFEAVKKNWVVKQKVYNQEPIGFQGMAFNLRREKFQDVRVRRALSMLMDRQTMNEKYMYNQYFLLNSYYPDLWENNRNPNAPLFTYAPDSARALLAAAGYKADARGVLSKNGKPLEITFITSSSEMRHLTLYQENLRQVGIVVNIEQMSQSTLRKRLDEADFDMYWVNWGAGRLRDPEASWSSLTANDKGTNNLSGLQDAVVDSLIQLQKTEFNLEKRNEILKALDNRLTELVPYVLMWQADHHRLLYWNRFGTPEKVLDKYNREDAISVYWFYDAKKDSMLQQAMQKDQPLKPVPAEIRR